MRVLRFDDAATRTNGANADGVLGQADFTTSTPTVSQDRMIVPRAVHADAGGRLWVADGNRLLRFDAAAGKPNGANADGVLGQPDFISNTAVVSQSGLNSPFGVYTDSFNRLYVADTLNNRVMIFNGAASLLNGANAANVLGQSDFLTGTANTGGLSASSLQNPQSVFFFENTTSLFVADTINNRVLRFFPAGPTASAVWVSGRVFDRRGRGVGKAIVKLSDGDGNTRSALTNAFGYYKFEHLAVGTTYVFDVRSKIYSFESHVVTVTDEVSNLDFWAVSQGAKE